LFPLYPKSMIHSCEPSSMKFSAIKSL